MHNIYRVDENKFSQKKHFIAYFDILGYETHIKSSNGSVLMANLLSSKIEFTKRSFEDLHNGKPDEYKVKIKMFSDNLIFCSEKNWVQVILYAYSLQKDLIKHGIFIRGSLSYGNLYFDDNFLCGEGIIEAYKIENQVSIFPRIVVDDSFESAALNKIEDFVSYATGDNSWNKEREDIYRSNLKLYFDCIATDFDGYRFTDYLSYFDYTVKNNDIFDSEEFFWVLEDHRRDIMSNVDEYSKSRRILQKYLWCKNYHNNFCKQQGYDDYIIE